MLLCNPDPLVLSETKDDEQLLQRVNICVITQNKILCKLKGAVLECRTYVSSCVENCNNHKTMHQYSDGINGGLKALKPA